jgi:type I restriction enzyme M protein
VPFAKILANHEFSYRTITIERLPRTSRAMSCSEPRGKQKGKQKADIKLHDTENVPMGGDVQTYLQCEVLPHGLDAWIDETKRDKKVRTSRHHRLRYPLQPAFLLLRAAAPAG